MELGVHVDFEDRRNQLSMLIVQRAHLDHKRRRQPVGWREQVGRRCRREQNEPKIVK